MQTHTVKKLFNAFEKLPLSEQKELYQRIRTRIEKPEAEIVGFTTSGEPLTADQYKAEVNEAIAQGESGEIISNETFKKLRESWK